MSWQAPNLLDRIFAKPEVADSNVIGNFMGGYMGGKKAAAENASAKSFNASAGASNTALDALGKAGLISTEGSTQTALMPESNWMQTWAKGTMDGKAAAGNWLQYQQAQTHDKLSQAQLEMAGADLAIKRNLAATQATTRQGEAALSEFMSTLSKDGGFADPVKRADAYKIAEQFPGVTGSPLWKNMQQNFTAADKAKVERAKYEGEATHQAEIAKAKAMELEKIRLGGKAVETGGNPFTVDQFGNQTVDLDLASKDFQVRNQEKDAHDIQKIEAQGRNQVANTEARGKISLEQAKLKLDEKLQPKASTFFKDHAAMAAYNGRQHSIKTDTKMSAIQKLQMLDKLDAEYGIHGAQVDDPNTPKSAPKPAPKSSKEAPKVPAGTIRFQNGNKYRVDADGNHQYIGPIE